MRNGLLETGALLSGLLALSCCGSALLFLLFGVSMASFGFLDALAPYQSWFQVGAVLLLLLAWVRLYRRRLCVRNRKGSFLLMGGLSLLVGFLLAVPYLEWE